MPFLWPASIGAFLVTIKLDQLRPCMVNVYALTYFTKLWHWPELNLDASVDKCFVHVFVSKKVHVVDICGVDQTSKLFIHDLQLLSLLWLFTSLLFEKVKQIRLWTFIISRGTSWHFYRKKTEPLYHFLLYSLVSHFFPVFIHYLQCIHCLNIMKWQN